MKQRKRMAVLLAAALFASAWWNTGVEIRAQERQTVEEDRGRGQEEPSPEMDVPQGGEAVSGEAVKEPAQEIPSVQDLEVSQGNLELKEKNQQADEPDAALEAGASGETLEDAALTDSEEEALPRGQEETDTATGGISAEEGQAYGNHSFISRETESTEVGDDQPVQETEDLGELTNLYVNGERVDPSLYTVEGASEEEDAILDNKEMKAYILDDNPKGTPINPILDKMEDNGGSDETGEDVIYAEFTDSDGNVTIRKLDFQWKSEETEKISDTEKDPEMNQAPETEEQEVTEGLSHTEKHGQTVQVAETQETSAAEVTAQGNQDAPSTGDDTRAWLWLFLLCGSLAAVLLLRKRAGA